MALFNNKRPISVPFGREMFSSLLGGSEGGLATTTAIIAGLFVSTNDRELVVLTATISFLVQAFNGAVGRFSAERTNDEIEQIEDKIGYKTPIMDALAQLTSHVFSAIIVIAPIVLIADVQLALVTTVSVSLILMFLMGAIKAHYVKNEVLHEGLEMLILGALVITVGLTAGWALQN